MIEEGKQGKPTRGEHSAQIIEIKPRKVFDHSEIKTLFPIVYRITRAYFEKVEKLLKKLEHIPKNQSAYTVTEREANALIQEWQVKVEKLGAVSKGLWIADFDSGDGYFCWKFPEEQILYWHGYRDGFSCRRPVKQYLDNKSSNVLPEQVSNHENRDSTNQHPHSEL
jgi:hypothetical protein